MDALFCDILVQNFKGKHTASKDIRSWKLAFRGTVIGQSEKKAMPGRSEMNNIKWRGRCMTEKSAPASFLTGKSNLHCTACDITGTPAAAVQLAKVSKWRRP
jgi:hypothetical protein